MDPAREDWASHDEGANQISHGGTFSNFALALPPRRSATYASWPSRPRESLLCGPSPGEPRVERPCARLGCLRPCRPALAAAARHRERERTRTRRAPSRGTRRGEDEPRYTTAYYSMEPAGKRTFFRMLYSGVRLSEAARRIAAVRGDVSPMTVDREK